MKPRKPHLYEALFSVLALIIVMGVSLVKYRTDPHVPMLIGSLFASLVAVRLGYRWSDIEKAMIDGISQAMQSIIILTIIGILIGVWILAGVVPTMIYYGLNIVSPKFFLLATLLICSITSLATGTSWGTAGTIGIALMGIGKGLGVPAPLVAGAIISGAYFGDKMSPLSDTTNLAPAVA
ncbi:MAG: Na+/H+ antiporter NhaC family protein, partial [Bacillota bacterium]